MCFSFRYRAFVKCFSAVSIALLLTSSAAGGQPAPNLPSIAELEDIAYEPTLQPELVGMPSYQDLKGVRMVTVAFGQIILSISRLVGLAVVAWMMSPKLAMVGLVVVPFGVVPAYLLGWRITVAARAERGTVQ